MEWFHLPFTSMINPIESAKIFFTSKLGISPASGHLLKFGVTTEATDDDLPIRLRLVITCPCVFFCTTQTYATSHGVANLRGRCGILEAEAFFSSVDRNVNRNVDIPSRCNMTILRFAPRFSHVFSPAQLGRNSIWSDPFGSSVRRVRTCQDFGSSFSNRP